MRRIFIVYTLFLAAFCLLFNGCHPRTDQSVHGQPGTQLSALDWFHRGNGWYEKGDYDRAVADYDRAIADYNRAREINLTLADVYNNRGLVWDIKGDYARAIADYNRAIEINPGYPDPYNNRGLVWEIQGDPDRAIADYTRALEVYPHFDAAYYNRGNVWYMKGDYNRAIADYDKALEIEPGFSAAYNNRGDARDKKGDYAQAIADYNRALAIDPRFVVAYNNQAWLLATCPDGKYRNGAKAVELALKAVELTPDVYQLDTLAAAYAEAGKFEDAIATQERVISLLNKEGDTEVLAESIERLRYYEAHKPWRAK
ncbi:MAG: tetratricopeptide repeat protein [Deltaproteobacteria bacterium]|nr:tetratricopeptide repeat protein [Deltaproteobacteria bacterium]